MSNASSAMKVKYAKCTLSKCSRALYQSPYIYTVTSPLQNECKHLALQASIDCMINELRKQMASKSNQVHWQVLSAHIYIPLQLTLHKCPDTDCKQQTYKPVWSTSAVDGSLSSGAQSADRIPSPWWTFLSVAAESHFPAACIASHAHTATALLLSQTSRQT